MEAPLWNLGCKIETNVFLCSSPFQFIYMGFELWAKPYGIKLRCYWEYLGEHILEQLVNLRIF
jgi:hypothetical protein